MTTCLVADDHPAVVEAVADVLGEHGIEIAGRARDGRDAVEQIELRKPQVAILDLRMPGMSGIEVARHVARTVPETAVILYTAFGDRALLTEALDAGARGFVLKEAPLAEVVRAVELVAAGRTYVDPVLAGRPLELSRDGEDEEPDAARARRASPAGGRDVERGDRQGAVHLARDGAHARAAKGDGQARSRHADRRRSRLRLRQSLESLVVQPLVHSRSRFEAHRYRGASVTRIGDGLPRRAQGGERIGDLELPNPESVHLGGTPAGASRLAARPVGSSTSRRRSTRFRFVAETSCPSAAA